MAYRLNKPYTEEEKLNFLVLNNDQRGLRTVETEAALFALEENEIMQDDEPIVDPQWNEKQKQKRKEQFEANFMETSYIKDGKTSWYRQIPKGYANAPQSIDIINNIVNMQGSLTEQVASMIIFYKKPNFAYKNQCTEEWLIEHSYNPDPMTLQEWTEFYISFQQKWAEIKYQQALKGETNV